jgi:hypothetical protein
MNPAAKYVSKKLKPLIRAAPTIIHGSKDLAIKLSQVKIRPYAKWFIVTGDVVAFYPNIPLERCIDIVTNMYQEFIFRNASNRTNLAFQEVALTVFKYCLHTGNRDLICEFQNEYFLQLQGLAMGVADSPDLANLFGAFFEQHVKILEDPAIAFYGRYIDDCLAIVYAQSEGEAVDYLQSKIRFDGCTIEWEASDSSKPFLDMLLYIDERSKLQWMPYRKARNHTERIPWISHHPLDVKRGTFMGEMSRLAVLSSHFGHYKDAIKALCALYIARGYPRELVVSWMRENIQARWNKRFAPPEKSLKGQEPESAGVLVLKTEYNLAWNYFNAAELGSTIFDYWSRWLERAETGNFSAFYPPPRKESDGDVAASAHLVRVGGSHVSEYWLPDMRKSNIMSMRVITSRKRTRNMYDLVNSWKRVVLEHLDERVAQEFEPQQGEDILMRDELSTVSRPPLSAADEVLLQDAQRISAGRVIMNDPLGPVDEDSDDEIQPARYRERSPAAPSGWSNASLSGAVRRM